MAASKRTVRIKPGDKVIVPLGLDDVVGTALEVYGPPGSRHVYVRIPILGPEGETLDEEYISFPLDRVSLVETAA
jgi:hypothetical protein